MQVLFGFVLAVFVSTLAWWAHALSRSGAVAATLLGTIIFGLGGLPWAILLLGFFVSSSLFSRLFGRRKSGLAEKFSKGSERDAGQVLANGGIASLMVILNELLPNSIWPWLGFAGSLAAVNADTWATELGVLSKSLPRLITNGKTVEAGTSGGISLAGSMSALAGSLLIALLAFFLWPGKGGTQGFLQQVSLVVLIGLAGLGGSLIDSLLGASIQAIYTCPVCQKETERHPYHTCGTPTILRRGWSWLNNDWVNIACAAGGAILAIVIVIWLPSLFGLSIV
jgi:Predicted membrane protein